MEQITFDEFKKLDIRIGKILSAEKVEGSDKLMKLMVDFGEPDLPAGRQVIAGIGQFYAPEALIGKECPFAYNLAPRTLKGLESQGMILCPSDNGSPVLLHPDKEIPPGSIVK
jgi:methionine--tRNA ligase beta chain